MGHIVSRIGLMGLGFIGAALLWSSTAIALMMPDPVGLGISLLLLGLAWNALYSAGSLLIDRYSPPEHRYRIQGINDTAVGFLAMLGAFLPGGALGGPGLPAGMNAAGLVAALGLMVMLAVCWRSSTGTSGLGLETAGRLRRDFLRAFHQRASFFMRDPGAMATTARVLATRAATWIILDRTIFYAESGGRFRTPEQLMEYPCSKSPNTAAILSRSRDRGLIRSMSTRGDLHNPFLRALARSVRGWADRRSGN